MLCLGMQACMSLPVDLICLDLTKRLPFRLKPPLLQAALARGVHFEVGAGG
jgi:ribonuclease P/MRP protein subunit RPP1